jgi:ATP-binding cassette subfamily C protein
MMIAVFSYLWFMMSPIQEIINIQYSFFSAKAALERINKLFELKKEPVYEHQKNPFSKEVTIETKNLYFKYKETQILENVNVKINPFKITALIGASGGGKTTFAKIISGMLVADNGDVLYNSVSYKEIGLNEIRKHVALILQETKLFNDTLRFNLTLGENFSDDEIKEALKKAELLNVVNKLPKGLDTFIGKNGVKLSGGERQRVAIARAILFKPEVVILDESTSALDIDTEDRVFKNIENFLKQRTSVIIAHRAETIAKADEILMVKERNIIKVS